MPFDHEFAAPVPPARLEVVSPWRADPRLSLPAAWLAYLEAAWREVMEMYARASPYRRFPWGFW